MTKKLFSFFIGICLITLTLPMAAMATEDIQAILKSDLEAVAPGAALDEDFSLVTSGPGGSSVTWDVSHTDLFDAGGKYLPRIGSGAIKCTLTPTLTYAGETLSQTYSSLSYRQPEYKLNGFIYEKADGTQIRHMQSGSRIVAADVEKNPRVNENAIILVGIYEQGTLVDFSSAEIAQSGLTSLDCAIGKTETTEMRCYLWDGMTTLKPIAVPHVQKLKEVNKNSFFNTTTAFTESGENASAAVDGDNMSEFRFSDTPEENTHSKSLYLYRASEEGSSPTVRYATQQLDGKLNFTLSFMMTEAELEKGLLYLYDQNATCVLSLIILGDLLQDNTNHEVCAGLLPYRWYTLKAELDTNKKTADVYINGELGYDDMPFRNDCSEISRIQIHNSADGESGLYIDDISFTNDGTEYLNENFNNCADGELPDGWTKLNERAGSIGAAEFTEIELSIYPQLIIADTGRYCNLAGVKLDIPNGMKLKYHIEVSTDNVTYVRVASSLTTPAENVVMHDLDYVQMRYLRLCIREATDSEGNYVNAAIKEIELDIVHEDSAVNVAPEAHVSVTSYVNTSLDARGLIDGIAARYARRGEWNASGEANPKVYMSWDEPQKIDTIELFGRLINSDGIGGVEILFDDGTVLVTKDIPLTGMPVKVNFEEKIVNWIRFRLIKTSTNPGLSEIRVLKSGDKGIQTEYLLADKTIPIPKDYGGQWTVSDDIDGNGSVEFVSARGYYKYGNHEVVAACAFDMDGNELWTWGTAGAGQTSCGSDLPCQIYDIDNDGMKEVLLSTKTQLIILNGQTGQQKAAHDLPGCENHPDEWASDCIIIADISGDGYPSDIIVKTRYTDAWAFTEDWKPIWHHCMPNGMKTAHSPEILDLDHDGHDEVFVGFCFIDDDGTIISALNEEEYNCPLAQGHVDSFAFLKFEEGMALDDMRFAVSPCGAGNFFIIDGTGKKLWESDSWMHYETLIAGKFAEGGSDVQLASNPYVEIGEPLGGSGYSTIHIYNPDVATEEYTACELEAEHWGFTTCRFIYSINMSKGECDYIYQPSDHILIDGEGRTRVRLVSEFRDNYASMRWEPFNGYHNDLDGDGTQDIASLSKRNGVWTISIYPNPNGNVTATKLGTGYNYTYY